MDKQLIFDRVTKHLLTQKSQSRDITRLCSYRGPGGKKCAIGTLILDKFYSSSFEGNDVSSNPVCRALESSLAYFLPGSLGCTLSGSDINFLLKLQSIHDNYSPHEWAWCLTNFALSEKLKFNPPKE